MAEYDEFEDENNEEDTAIDEVTDADQTPVQPEPVIETPYQPEDRGPNVFSRAFTGLTQSGSGEDDDEEDEFDDMFDVDSGTDTDDLFVVDTDDDIVDSDEDGSMGDLVDVDDEDIFGDELGQTPLENANTRRIRKSRFANRNQYPGTSLGGMRG